MLNTELQKNLKIENKVELNYILLRQNKFLLFKNYNKYFLIPSNVICSYEKDALTLKIEDKKHYSEMNLVYNSILSFLKLCSSPIKKVLKLKGLGFRMNVIKELNLVEFKLGFSHLKTLKIPAGKINVFIQKSNIFVEGIDSILIGNFLNKIRSLKVPDIYKGKGFWYKYQKESFKVIKKK